MRPMTDQHTTSQPAAPLDEPGDDLEALAAADPADAPVIADRIAAGLADRLEAGGREQETSD